MNGWSEGLAGAIDYIEGHLAEEIDMDEAARRANVSTFYFQRVFHALCGQTLGEYIRARRLTLAAQELSANRARVIDVALKYGYDSPDSFARAFARFHGVTPSAAREPGARLNAVAPLKIKVTLEGGTMLEYKIVKKEQFTVMGVSRRFNNETSYQEIPKFWDEHMAGPMGQVVRGYYGICLDMAGSDFDYLIADGYDPCKDLPEGCATKVIPAATWAVFPCTLKTLQSVNTRIYSEWLPANGAWQLAQSISVEAYLHYDPDPDKLLCEIWIPVEKV